MFVSELIFLGLCAVMDGKRQAALERICGIDSSKFAATAKECSDLMGMQKQFRVQADTSAAEMMRYLYDPDSKARILTLLLATVATFVALLNHSAGPEDFDILAAWEDPGFMRLFVLMMSLASPPSACGSSVPGYSSVPTTAAFRHDTPSAAPVPPQHAWKVDASSIALARVVQQAS